jgi:hypothetical protein
VFIEKCGCFLFDIMVPDLVDTLKSDRYQHKYSGKNFWCVPYDQADTVLPAPGMRICRGYGGGEVSCVGHDYRLETATAKNGMFLLTVTKLHLYLSTDVMSGCTSYYSTMGYVNQVCADPTFPRFSSLGQANIKETTCIIWKCKSVGNTL